MTCHHLTSDHKCGLGVARGINGGPIPLVVCNACPQYDGPIRGLGDMVAKATKAVGIKPCEGCNRRRAALNNAISFNKETPVSATP